MPFASVISVLDGIASGKAIGRPGDTVTVRSRPAAGPLRSMTGAVRSTMNRLVAVPVRPRWSVTVIWYERGPSSASGEVSISRRESSRACVCARLAAEPSASMNW